MTNQIENRDSLLQDPVIEPVIESTEFLYLTMDQRLEVLKRCNQRGWVYKVGSLPNIGGFVEGTGPEYAQNVFSQIIIPEAQQTGVVTVFQRAGAIPGIGMNQEPYYHPDLGLILNEHGNIVFQTDFNAEQVTQQAAGGIDFDPQALPSWQVIQTNAQLLRSLDIQVIKTQLTSLNCARFNLAPEVGAIQEELMSALAATHLSKAAELAPVVCVSLDNPNNDVIEGLPRDMKNMFGMEWDENGDVSDYGLLGALNIVPALHSCGQYEMLQAMKLGVGLVHADFATHNMDELLRGDIDVLRQFFNRQGLIAVGVIPQSENAMEALASESGIELPEGKNRYKILIEKLREKNEAVIQIVFDKYARVLDYISQQTGIDRNQLQVQCVPSYLCGFGGTRSIPVVQYSLELAQAVSDKIWGKN
ncbi:hypothetical protein A2W14_01000 [Candidatus Gottesmanbacteria bacterium RBG_16_37_8]|uniref:Uroporphyrinogen decarboxylase (URO-D) domain-containing protein n=1 Tax=Candidatus Gottesmanbacteria bacterium RBG_16_37_8 TaxID=1798371 RepID=A0A1F5YQ13_9BACT|nr:MAG: hypothetical protein A2W14_01000 [Candidatus Gottesmanbacteria bacterium RBG_16_37_8]